MPSAFPCSLSSISCIHFCLFLDWRCTVSFKFFVTQVPLISTEELLLPCHACCVLSHPCCNKRSLLLSSYFSTIGRIDLYLSMTFGPGPGELPSFWGSMILCHAPILWKGSGNNNNMQSSWCLCDILTQTNMWSSFVLPSIYQKYHRRGNI